LTAIPDESVCKRDLSYFRLLFLRSCFRLLLHKPHVRLLFPSAADPIATLAFGISNKFFLKVPYLTIRQTQSTTFSFARKFNSRRARR
jgi:hypothetical protein